MAERGIVYLRNRCQIAVSYQLSENHHPGSILNTEHNSSLITHHS